MQVFTLDTFLFLYPLDAKCYNIVGKTCAILFGWTFILNLILESYIGYNRACYDLADPVWIVIPFLHLFSTAGMVLSSLILVQRKFLLTWLTWTLLTFLLHLALVIVAGIFFVQDLIDHPWPGYTTRYVLGALTVTLQVLFFFWNWFISIYAWLVVRKLYENEYFRRKERPLTKYELLLIDRVDKVGRTLENQMYWDFIKTKATRGSGYRAPEMIQAQGRVVERIRVAGARVKKDENDRDVKEQLVIEEERVVLDDGVDPEDPESMSQI